MNDFSLIYQRYRLGMCDALALAVHDHTGWPLALWSGELEDDLDDEEETWVQAVHAVVVDPETGRWFDIDGFHPAEEVPSNLYFESEPISIFLEPSTVEDVTFAFSMSGVTEDEKIRAWKDLELLGLSSELPEKSHSLYTSRKKGVAP